MTSLPRLRLEGGGLAPVFDGATHVIEKIDPDLTLWGLQLIYRRNRP